MIKNILTYPQDKEILTQKSKKVEDFKKEEINVLIEDLIDTLNSTGSGVGISAIQIGVPKQVCVVKYNGKNIIMINPEITRTRGEVTFREGCLSAPAVYTETKRAQKVWITYLDENGEEQELSQGGLCSVIIQHELEHFDGSCVCFDEYDKVMSKKED